MSGYRTIGPLVSRLCAGMTYMKPVFKLSNLKREEFFSKFLIQVEIIPKCLMSGLS